MSDPLRSALSNLTDVQREAVDWRDGALLVLAGPGSGKTQVLTCRIGRLLDGGKDQNFRVLALTFTNKAADEMKERVGVLVPGLEDRAYIGTFHSFCGQVLRQHGVHIGISPDFTIYALDTDRKAILQDAIRKTGEGGETTDPDANMLPLIDRLKSRLIPPSEAESRLSRMSNPARISSIYAAYESELKASNALDFNSLILETYNLFSRFPAIAARYRRTYPFWLLDEFQDTTDAQYRLIRAMAGEQVHNIFAVADDDQIIYQWNGASFRQIQRFQADHQAAVIQLPTNYRCPPAIVEAANRLVAYNVQRTAAKKPLVAGKTNLRLPEGEHIQIRVYDDATEESAKIADEISAKGMSHWHEITVLARTRALLEGMHKALTKVEVSATIAQRRDDFLSPEVRCTAATLRQICRPMDKRNVAGLVEAFNRVATMALSAEQIVAEAEVTGQSYLGTWLAAAQSTSSIRGKLLHGAASRMAEQPSSSLAISGELVTELEMLAQAGEEADTDLREDISAWHQLFRDIGRQIGIGAPLDQFLQELQLRSKEPSPAAHSVSLMTVHAAKGREFDTVYVIGLAEDVLPSFQSKQKGNASAEMEEERRNCFVAITRAKECLVLSRSRQYRGWQKAPSRFLVEMGFAVD